MAKVFGIVRVLALLLAVWSLLLLAAYLGGVLPTMPWQRQDPPEDRREARAPIVELPDAGVAPADAGVVDAGTIPVVEEAAPPVREGLARFIGCREDALAPRLSMVSLSNGRPELALGCGRETHLLSIGPGADGALRPTRIVRLHLATDARGGAPAGATVVTDDFNGDDRTDLALGYLVPSSRGATQRGALYFLARDERGGLAAPVSLAPIAVASLASADIDGEAGRELVALHQADTHGRRPSEAWVFGGTSTLARMTRLDAGVTGRVVGAIDLDRDGHVDIFTLAGGDPGGRVSYGDGQGRFPRTEPLLLAGATAATVADLDADGAEDLIVSGDSVRVVRALAGPSASDPIALGVPAGASNLHVADVDGDGRPDLLALVDGGIVQLIQTAPDRFEVRPLLDLPLAVGTIDAFVAAPLGAEETLDLILLVERAEDDGYDLVIVTDPGEHAVAGLGETALHIEDAPLRLDVALR